MALEETPAVEPAPESGVTPALDLPAPPAPTPSDEQPVGSVPQAAQAETSSTDAVLPDGPEPEVLVALTTDAPTTDAPSAAATTDDAPSAAATTDAATTGGQDSAEATDAEEEGPPSPVNYDEEGIGEVEIEGSIYRFDSGKQGTALCLSRRQEGAWRWNYLGELRWDGRDLRSKALERSLLTQLSTSLRALAEAAS